MRTVFLTFALLSAVSAAEWLNQGGDARHSGWQPNEKQLTVANVHGLKLLWMRPLDSALTAPAMLGPIITHRGIKELVFIASASNTVYAVDADLGRVFWKRHFETGPVPLCSAGLTATPAIAPSTNANPNAEWSSPLRSIYVVSSDGTLHTIRASDGEDMAAPVRFLPPGAIASNLAVAGDSIRAVTAAGCGEAGDGEWWIHLVSGKISRTQGPRGDERRATWKDRVFSASPSGLVGFEGARRVWNAANVQGRIAPVVANGIVYALSSGPTHATLYALDALTGKQLYASGDAIGLPITPGGLALANGHVCFGTGSTLYCFGIPFEI